MTTLNVEPQRSARSADVFSSLRGDGAEKKARPDPAKPEPVAPMASKGDSTGTTSDALETVGSRLGRVAWHGRLAEEAKSVDETTISARDRFRYVPWDPSQVAHDAALTHISNEEAQEIALAYAGQRSVRSVFAKMK